MNRKMMSLAMLVLMAGILTISSVEALADNAYELTVSNNPRVCPKADYQSIQQAVLAAPPHATIEVCPGTYNEVVNVPKPLTISGAGIADHDRENNDSTEHGRSEHESPGGETILNGSFNLAENDITIEGFTIQNSPTAGISTSPAFSGYVIRYNIIRNNNGNGLYLNSSGVYATEVEHNFFNLNRPGNILSELGLSNALIEENKLIGDPGFAPDFLTATSGIEISGGFGPAVTQTNIVIRRNEFLKHGTHIVMYFTTSSQITDNVGRDSAGTGFYIGSGTSGVNILTNTVTGSGAGGIVLDGSVDPTIGPTHILVKNNFLFRNGRNGILLSFASANTVQENKCVENGQNPIYEDHDGISIRNFSNDNIVRENKCLHNLRDGIRIARNLSSSSEAVFGATPRNNSIEHNLMRDNFRFDASDFTVGPGTAGTANFWIDDDCVKENRPGLCSCDD